MGFISDLITEITEFRTVVGTKLNALKSYIGNLPSLTTTHKTTIVGAINEVNQSLTPNTLAQLNAGTSTTGATQTPKNLNDWIVAKNFITSSSLTGYVTLATEQVVTGKKTFSNTLTKIGTSTNYVTFDYEVFPGETQFNIYNLTGTSSRFIFETYNGGIGLIGKVGTTDRIALSSTSTSAQFQVMEYNGTELFKIAGANANNASSFPFFQMDKQTMKFALGYFVDNSIFSTRVFGIRGKAYFGDTVESNGFMKHGSNDDYFLRGGGGHILINNFVQTSALNSYVRKDTDSLVTQDFALTNGQSKFRMSDTYSISLENVHAFGTSFLNLNSEDGYALSYQYDNMNVEVFTRGIGWSANGNYASIIFDGKFSSRLVMPETDDHRFIAVGAKVGSQTIYADPKGIINLPSNEAVMSYFDILDSLNLDFMHYSNMVVNDGDYSISDEESIHRQIGNTNYYMREPYLYVRGKKLPNILNELVALGYKIDLNVGRYLPKRSRKTENENWDYDNISDGIGLKHQRAKYRYRRVACGFTGGIEQAFHDIVRISPAMINAAMEQHSEFIRLDDFNLHSFFTTFVNYNDFNGYVGMGNEIVTSKAKGKKNGSKTVLRLCFRFIISKNDDIITTQTIGYLTARVNRRQNINSDHLSAYYANYISGSGLIGSYNYDNKKY